MYCSKGIVVCITFVFFSAMYLNSTDTFDIVLKSKWRLLSDSERDEIDFGGKWVLVGSITFKKKSKDPLIVDRLVLRWNGDFLENLESSLYKKISCSQSFIPIEKNVVCDGIWNKSKQSVIFNFDTKETLHPRTTFYVVFTIPASLENILKNGNFFLEQEALPKPFKQPETFIHLSFGSLQNNTEQINVSVL